MKGRNLIKDFKHRIKKELESLHNRNFGLIIAKFEGQSIKLHTLKQIVISNMVLRQCSKPVFLYLEGTRFNSLLS
jgi:hypothetical protein